MKLALTIIISLLLSLLGGCSWLSGEDGVLEDKEYDYTQAKITDELSIPEEVGESNTQDLFLVPELDDDYKGIVYGVDNEILAPMQVLTLGSKARANRNSSLPSVYITATKDEVVASIKSYLESEKLAVQTMDVDSGVIVTDWKTTEDDSFWGSDISAWRYRFKITIGDTKAASEQELTVELTEAEKLVEKSGNWEQLKESGRNETGFLNSILGYIYVEEISKSRSLVNQSAFGGVTVDLGMNSDGKISLLTDATFEHSWSRVPIAMKLLKVTVEDQDRSKGLYFITLKDEEGFFDSLAFWSENEGSELGFPDKNYRIKVSKLGEKVSITFLDDQDDVVDTELMTQNFPILSKAFKTRVTE